LEKNALVAREFEQADGMTARLPVADIGGTGTLAEDEINEMSVYGIEQTRVLMRAAPAHVHFVPNADMRTSTQRKAKSAC
jgi:hypothetical protein